MATQLHVKDPWRQITAKARRSRGDVAVAYLGRGAWKLLPLKPGSRLVVDASEGAVRSGQTDPRELLKYLRGDVDVFSVTGLHAKVFAFTGVAFVGSTNVSRRSAEYLIEASLESTERSVVAGAKKFVVELARAPIGEEFAKSLVKIYRPPRVAGGKRRRTRGSAADPHGTAEPTRVVRLHLANWDDAENEADEKARRVAKAEKRRGFELNSFNMVKWSPNADKAMVVQALKEKDGRVMVSPPGRVLAAEPVRGKKSRQVVLEVPPRRRRSIESIRSQHGPAFAKRLLRGGRLSAETAARVHDLWKVRLM
jgi:hypothetical protein